MASAGICRSCGSDIFGDWVGHNAPKQSISNPATGEIIGCVPVIGKVEVVQCISLASVAQKKWKAKTAKERCNLLKKWFDLIQENSDDLAKIITSEQGKSIHEAKGEVAYAASFIEWFAEEAKRTYGETIPAHKTAVFSEVLRPFLFSQ